MTLLRPAPHSSRQFTFDRESNLLVTEASNLGTTWSGRVYSDACDTGFTIVSSRTGREVVYAITHEEWRDGDLLYWDAYPLGRGGRRDYDLPMARIFND